MIKKIAFLILLATTLAGCGPIYNTSYTYQVPRGMQGKECIIQCQQARTMCDSACMSQNNECQMRADQQAHYDYKDYKSQRKAEGKEVKRDKSSFYNDYSCNQSCGCESQFNSCYTMCGGQVMVHKTCVAFCDKVPAETTMIANQ